MNIKVGDRVRLKEATVREIRSGVATLKFDGAADTNCINIDKIARVLPRPFRVGDLVRSREGDMYSIWEIVYVSDQITLGKVRSTPSQMFKIGHEGVIDTKHMERVG